MTSFSSPQRETAVGMARPMRQISQARRLLQLHNIRGAEANRIRLLITQAEQRLNNGSPLEAIRLSRRALSSVREFTGPQKNPLSQSENENDENETNRSSPISNSDENEKTPISNPLNEENEPIFQRRTRYYADGSDDGGISFQYEQPLTPNQAPFAVRQHELSHIWRETIEAILDGQRVLTALTVRSQINQQTGEREIRGGQARIAVFPNIELIPPDNLGNNVDLMG